MSTNPSQGPQNEPSNEIVESACEQPNNKTQATENQKNDTPSSSETLNNSVSETTRVESDDKKPEIVPIMENAPVPQRVLVVIQEAQTLVGTVTTAFQKSRTPPFLRRYALFLACVVLPTLLACLCYGFYISDIYVSESKYVVRSPNKKSSASGLGAMLEGAGFSGFSRAQEDVYTVSEYVVSRDAMNFLNEKLDLAKAWSSPRIDLFHRFDPFAWDSSIENLHEYYLKRVTVSVDPLSGITTLTASVFSPVEAYEMNKALLGEAERIVNILNERGRTDLIRFAENEVKVAEQKSKAAANTLSNFRNTQAVVDPERQTQLHYEHISRLQEELVKTRAQLTQLRVFAPKSPHPPALELREKTIEKEIEKEMQKITGGENSLASKAAEYERLALDREFADKQLASALASLEVARNEAQRQQLYLETISKPNLPDEAVLPKRFWSVLSTVVLGFIAWGILSMLLAGVREHQY
jgi:capsular polysaccharide transport system permease protein